MTDLQIHFDHKIFFRPHFFYVGETKRDIDQGDQLAAPSLCIICLLLSHLKVRKSSMISCPVTLVLSFGQSQWMRWMLLCVTQYIRAKLQGRLWKLSWVCLEIHQAPASICTLSSTIILCFIFFLYPGRTHACARTGGQSSAICHFVSMCRCRTAVMQIKAITGNLSGQGSLKVARRCGRSCWARRRCLPPPPEPESLLVNLSLVFIGGNYQLAWMY